MADVRLTATNPADSSVVPVACNEKGELKLEEIPDQSFDGNLQGDLTVSGNATVAGNITAGDYPSPAKHISAYALLANANPKAATIAHSGVAIYQDGNNNGSIIVRNQQGAAGVQMDGYEGYANFAHNKAGFTAEGHLWCTTRRGDTVMLDATSNGLASWVPYTPPSRLTELQDRWAEKDGILPVPHDSSQDEPETPQ